MAEATQEMVALAERIADEQTGTGNRGNHLWEPRRDAALAAIQATTARAANLADGWLGVDFDESANCMAANIRDDLLANVHLKEQSA